MQALHNIIPPQLELKLPYDIDDAALCDDGDIAQRRKRLQAG